MGVLARYQAYVDAFEQSVAGDDWARIDPFFTDEAVLISRDETVAHGKHEVVARLKNSVVNFDPLMDSRTPDFEPQSIDGNSITMKWTFWYTKSRQPVLVTFGQETAVFAGEQIEQLQDVSDNAMQQSLGASVAG
jgi:hypothetical protein